MTSPRTGWVESPLTLLHDPGPGHPERAARLIAIRDRVASAGLLDELALEVAPEASVRDLLAVHPAEYVQHVADLVDEGAAFVDSPDANVGHDSYRAALAAVGAANLAVDRVFAGEWRNAFVAVRPPGHHAERARAMGFCLFNNIAIAAQRLRVKHGLERVAIVDWDVHHGNGTQHLTERDPSIFYASLHQFPHYPGTGASTERGIGDGAGSVINCPLAAGTGDAEWLTAFEDQVLPALEAFAPDFLLVSAGFDAHARDPLSATLLSADAYARMTRGLLALAAERCNGRLVALLEGGYDLQGLAESTLAHVAELRDAGRTGSAGSATSSNTT